MITAATGIPMQLLGRNIPYEKVLALLPQTEKRTWTIECCRKEDVLQTIKILEVLKK